MRSLKNKKGISDVVGVAVITMLTVVALYLAWSYVSGFTNNLDSQLSPVSECLQLNVDISLACYNAVTQQVELAVSTGADDNIKSLTFVASDGQNSQTHVCGSSNQADCKQSCIVPTSGEAKQIFIPLQVQPTSITYFANNCGQFAKSINQIPSCS